MKKRSVLLLLAILMSVSAMTARAEALVFQQDIANLRSPLISENQLWLIDDYSQSIREMDLNGAPLEEWSMIEALDAPGGCARYRVVLRLLENQGRIYALKATLQSNSSRDLTSLESVQLYELYDGQAPANTLLTDFDWSRAIVEVEGNLLSASIRDAFLMDGRAYLLFSGLEENYQVFSMETGMREDAHAGDDILTIAKGGAGCAVAARTNSAEKIEIGRLQDGNWRKVIELPAEMRSISGLAEEGGKIYFVHSGVLYAVDPSGEISALMSVPQDIETGGLADGQYYGFSNRSVYRFPLSQQGVQGSLIIYNEQGTPDAANSFKLAHPDVAIQTVANMNKDEIYTQLLSHSLNADLLGSDSANLPIYRDIVSRGYFAPIQSEALNRFAQNCYPSVRDILYVDGQLAGIPVRCIPCFQPAVNTTLWHELNLPLPETWGELLHFIRETWPSLQGEHPGLCAISRDDFDLMFYEMLDDYAYFRAKQDSDPGYDTPEFRTVMDAYLGMNPQALFEMQEDDAQALFFLEYQFTPEVGSFEGYAHFPIGFTEDSTSKSFVSLGLVTINPDSPNQELCEEYLEFLVKHMNPVDRAILQMNENDPIVNEGWEAMMAQYEKNVKEYQDAIAAISDPSEKAARQMELDNYIRQSSALQDSKWWMSPESIRAYRRGIQDQFVQWDEALNERENQFRDELISDVFERTIGIDRLVAKLNQLYYFRLLEDR